MTDDFPRALSGASQVKNRQKRGYALEKLVQELFERAHFNVTPNSRVASPRQTDLLAVRGPARYLIECKWQKQPAHIGDVDALRSRLERTSSNTTGLLVSVSGFTAGAMDLVESRRERPLVLVTHGDLTDLCREPERLVRMLDAKLANLVDDARVSPVTTASRRTRRSAPPPLSTFRSLSGEALPVIEGDGDYAPFVYAPEISDIDWVRGSGVGVSLDLRADVSSQLALLDLLHDLTRLGWSTPSARWSFRQGTKEWHGCGAGEFALAFKAWAARMDSLSKGDRHGTEDFQYVDHCDLGFYTLAGNVLADSRRLVRHATISFQLSGIPLDTSAYEELDKLVGSTQAYFRPLSGPSLTRTHNPSPGDCVVSPVAWLVREFDDGPWVVGLVVSNPLQGDAPEGASWLPSVLKESSVLICALGSWHPVHTKPKTYWLRLSEEAWTSDVAVVRVVAQYEDRNRRARSDRAPRSKRPQRPEATVV